MKKLLLASAALVGAALFGSAASASSCPANPYTLTNGSTADATQIMADFNNLLNCLNLNVAPLASPTFTGTVTIPTLTVTGAGSISGNFSVSGSTTHTGAVTATGGVVASGGSLPGIDAQTPNNVTTGGLRVRANAASGFAYIQITDSTAANEWGYFKIASGAGDAGPITWNGGLFTFNGGVTVNSGLTVSGALSLPAGSVTSAMLANIDGSSTNCGSATQACVLGFNAQGQMTSLVTATIIPSMTGQSGALLTNNGSAQSWAMRASGYFSSCSSGGCTLAAGNGVSSISRIGTGSYTVNFSVTFPNANYTLICTSGTYGGGSNATCVDSGSHGLSSAGIQVVTGGNNPIDPTGGLNVLVIQN